MNIFRTYLFFHHQYEVMQKVQATVRYYTSTFTKKSDLKNISISSSEVGTGLCHNSLGHHCGSIIDIESTGSSTNHHGVYRQHRTDVKLPV